VKLIFPRNVDRETIWLGWWSPFCSLAPLFAYDLLDLVFKNRQLELTSSSPLGRPPVYLMRPPPLASSASGGECELLSSMALSC
jgi:hypothetical protein